MGAEVPTGWYIGLVPGAWYIRVAAPGEMLALLCVSVLSLSTAYVVLLCAVCCVWLWLWLSGARTMAAVQSRPVTAGPQRTETDFPPG